MKTIKETLYAWSIDSHVFHTYDYTDMALLTDEMYTQIGDEKAQWLKAHDRSDLQVVFTINKPLVASSVNVQAIVEFYNEKAATEYYLRWTRKK